MKTIVTTLSALALAVGMLGIAEAQSPNRAPFFRSTKSVEKISSMKPGDRYVLVCRDCETATVGEIADAADAEKLCHDGGTIHCDGCKKKVTIKRVGPPGKGTPARTKREVTYLNSKGEECMVLIPLKD
ncbi:hypothetical protein [Haloferula sargassicola]|uniref:DUF5679 domain-containing protein n=1 Tax=Haloferula sargassicola TaxID=490096 RepID=A0ABP9UTF5_9BACT